VHPVGRHVDGTHPDGKPPVSGTQEGTQGTSAPQVGVHPDGKQVGVHPDGKQVGVHPDGKHVEGVQPVGKQVDGVHPVGKQVEGVQPVGKPPLSGTQEGTQGTSAPQAPKHKPPKAP
jgi:hypothetical protein